MLDLLDPLRWLLAIPFISGLAITLYVHPNIFLSPPPLFSLSTQLIIAALGIALVVLASNRNAPAPAPIPQSEPDTSQTIHCPIRAFKVDAEQETDAGEMSGASEDTLVQELGLQGDGHGDGDDPEKKIVIALRRGGDEGDNSPFFPVRNGEDEPDATIPRGHAFLPDSCPNTDNGDWRVNESEVRHTHMPALDDEDDDEGRVNADPCPTARQQYDSSALISAPQSSFGSAGERSEIVSPPFALGLLSLPEDEANISNDEDEYKVEVWEEFSVLMTGHAGAQPPSTSFEFNSSVPLYKEGESEQVEDEAGETVLDDEYEHEHHVEIQEEDSEDFSSLLVHTPLPVFRDEVMSNGGYECDPGIREEVSPLDNEIEAGVKKLRMDADVGNDPIRTPSHGDVDVDNDGLVDVLADPHPYLAPVSSIVLAPSTPTICHTPLMLSSDSTTGTPTPTPALSVLSLFDSDEGDGTEQTAATPRSRWAGPMLTKRWPVYVLEEGEGGTVVDDGERSVWGVEGDGDRGGEISLSLDVEDILRLGGDGWSRLLDIDVGVGEQEDSHSLDDDSRWSTEVNLSVDGDSRSGWGEDREFDVGSEDEGRTTTTTTHTHSTHPHRLTNTNQLADISISTMEKEAEDAVQAMHRRRAKEREKAREKKKGGRRSMVITVTPPTPPNVVVPASLVNGEGENEWALAVEMKQFWRERVEKRQRDEEQERREGEEASFCILVPMVRVLMHFLISRIPPLGRVLYDSQGWMVLRGLYSLLIDALPLRPPL